MAVNKLDPKIIFASEAPVQDTPAVFNNRTLGWGESRKNGGRPTIKQMNALQQDTELKILWLNENAVVPFDATIDYPVNAVTIKDGQFKIFNGTSWNLFLDKSSVGLNNVDNTSDLNKPISTSVKAKLDYIDNNGAALPYKDGITYEENAVVVKDGVLKQWKGGEWLIINKNIHNELAGREVADAHPASAISYGSVDQKTVNDGLESIADMLAIANPVDGSRVFVKGFQGDNFVYDPTKASVNDNHHVFNGWVRHVPYLHVSPLQWGADPTGQNDSTEAFKSFRDHLQYMAFNSTFPPVACIPAGYYVVRDEIEFYDLSNCTIYSLGAMIGYVGSKVSDSIIKINNAVNTKIIGSLTLTAWGQDNAQCGLLVTASAGSKLQASGIANHLEFHGITVRNMVCGFQLGEDAQDYDKHVAELHFVGCNTMVCRTAARIYGSQTEGSFDGCTLASGFFNESDKSVYHAILDIRGGIVTINGGSLVNSMLSNDFTNAVGFDVRPALSTQYNNPYPVVAIDTAHIELTTPMLNVAHGGRGGGDSAISNVSIQNCKGWMGMLPSEALIRIWDSSYVGKLSIGSSNNFYTSLNRTGKNIICDAPNAVLDVSAMAFGEQMQQGFGSIVGGILKHPLKLVSQTNTLNSTLATGKQAIVFTTANRSGDLERYAVYNTTNGNIQFPHDVKSINIKMNIVGDGINVTGDIFIEKNGAIVCYANKNTLFATLDYTDNNVLSTDVYRVYFNKPDAVTLSSGGVSNISIFAET